MEAALASVSRGVTTTPRPEDPILGLDQPSRKRLGRNVPQPKVMRQLPEERYPLPNQHRESVDDDPIDEPRPQKGLNRLAAVDIDVPNPALFEKSHRFIR